MVRLISNLLNEDKNKCHKPKYELSMYEEMWNKLLIDYSGLNVSMCDNENFGTIVCVIMKILVLKSHCLNRKQGIDFRYGK